jgi:glycosyltransferase involved in cell wall biosynthesis
MKILYLYAEVMGYTMATIRAMVESGAEVHVVHWDHKKLTPYQAPLWPNVYMYKRSEMMLEDMQQLAATLTPAITYVSGWMDKEYMAVARQLRVQGGIVVMGIDGHWHGTLRQRLAALLGNFSYFTRFYSHAWVAGPYQFEIARRLGFDKKRIVYDLYSADLALSQAVYRNSLQQKKNSYPHRFLFVGRLESVKGLDTLLQAWNMLREHKRDWELHLVGNGSLKVVLESSSVVVKDFMQPDQLMEEVYHAGCFVLPSRCEPWGVVVHEFAGAGLPLIVSDVVGAASTFLINGLNGYTFPVNDAKALGMRMKQIIDLSDKKLISMSEESHNLSQRISSQSSAANLLSIIN